MDLWICSLNLGAPHETQSQKKRLGFNEKRMKANSAKKAEAKSFDLHMDRIKQRQAKIRANRDMRSP